MAVLTCILGGLPKDDRVASFRFLKSTPRRHRNSEKTLYRRYCKILQKSGIWPLDYVAQHGMSSTVYNNKAVFETKRMTISPANSRTLQNEEFEYRQQKTSFSTPLINADCFKLLRRQHLDKAAMQLLRNKAIQHQKDNAAPVPNHPHCSVKQLRDTLCQRSMFDRRVMLSTTAHGGLT